MGINQAYDKREAYIQRVKANAGNDIGRWFNITILKDSRKRARMFNLAIDIDQPYLVELWNKQEGRCAISGIQMQTQSGTVANKNPYRASLDRIDNAKGYVKGNVRFTTHWINNAKSTWSDDVFDDFVTGIATKRQTTLGG